MKRNIFGKNHIQKISLDLKKAYRPTKIKKEKATKSMKLGNKILIYIIFFILFSNFNLLAEDRIISTPLINLNEIKPSFEETDDLSNEIPKEEIVLNKRKTLNDNKLTAEFIGLDKITAKTSAIVVSLGEIKKFGPLEIKVLKCGKVSFRK